MRDQVRRTLGRHGEGPGKLGAEAARLDHLDRIDALRDAGEVERRSQLRRRVEGHGCRRIDGVARRDELDGRRAVESRSGERQCARGPGDGLGRDHAGQLDGGAEGLEMEAARRGDRIRLDQDVPDPWCRGRDEQLRVGRAGTRRVLIVVRRGRGRTQLGVKCDDVARGAVLEGDQK